jgi:hypothetical protein
MLIDFLKNDIATYNAMTDEQIIKKAITYSSIKSLFISWLSGLSYGHKQVLYCISQGKNTESEIGIDDVSIISDLLSSYGRGVLYSEEDGSEKNYLFVSPLFEEYVKQQGESIYRENAIMVEPGNAQIEPSGTTIKNITIYGNYIEKIESTTNVINIENAVNGLEDLYKYVSNNSLADKEMVTRDLQNLPFVEAIWNDLKEDEQDKECNAYADGVFQSGLFSDMTLTNEQMDLFYLTDDIMNGLTEKSRKQLISGIQVYLLIQQCIDKFGLQIAESESPRGILFGRFYENLLKDTIFTAFNRVEALSTFPANDKKKTLSEIGVDRTTIGTYSTILSKKEIKNILEDASRKYVVDDFKDFTWWDTYSNKLDVIRELRNDCCHSGTTFTNVQLTEMIKYIFELKSISDALFFDRIPHLSLSQLSFPNKNIIKQLLNNTPPTSIVGSVAQFEMVEKTTNGKYRGIVNGMYVGSILKGQTEKITLSKGDVISVKVASIQDGRCVLDIHI